MTFIFWLAAGVALGMILMAFLAVGMYQRGYEAGAVGRTAWRTELASRRRAFEKVYERAMTDVTSSRTDDALAVETARRAAVPTSR